MVIGTLVLACRQGEHETDKIITILLCGFMFISLSAKIICQSHKIEVTELWKEISGAECSILTVMEKTCRSSRKSEKSNLFFAIIGITQNSIYAL